MKGRVKWFNEKKGFGFIVPDDGSSDVFVHYSSINSDDEYKTLATDQAVEFNVTDGQKGLQADDVVILEDAI